MPEFGFVWWCSIAFEYSCACIARDDDCNCDRDYYFDCIVSHEYVRYSVWNVCFSACEVLSSDCIPVLFLQPCSCWISCYFGEGSQFIAMSWISVALLQLLTFAIGMQFFSKTFCWKVLSFFDELKVGNTFAYVLHLNIHMIALLVKCCSWLWRYDDDCNSDCEMTWNVSLRNCHKISL